MIYESYPNKKSVPSRMTRKQARRKVFVTNKKARRLEKKQLRLEKHQQAEEAAS